VFWAGLSFAVGAFGGWASLKLGWKIGTCDGVVGLPAFLDSLRWCLLAGFEPVTYSLLRRHWAACFCWHQWLLLCSLFGLGWAGYGLGRVVAFE
jgi:hypothetical protein